MMHLGAELRLDRRSGIALSRKSDVIGFLSTLSRFPRAALAGIPEISPHTPDQGSSR